jgi:hypothetical protein
VPGASESASCARATLWTIWGRQRPLEPNVEHVVRERVPDFAVQNGIFEASSVLGALMKFAELFSLYHFA